MGKSGPLAKSPTYERSNMRKSPGFEDESFSKPQKDSAIDVIFGNREKETDKGVKKSKDTPWQPPGSQIRKSPVSPKERYNDGSIFIIIEGSQNHRYARCFCISIN